jgi:hypothetical protein
LRDVAAQFHPAIVFHLFDFQRSGEVGVVINKTALLSLRLRGGGRWAIKAPSAAKSGAVVIIMMAAIAANFFILSLPLMSVRSPLNRVILNNFLREKFIYYCCTAGLSRGFTGVIKEGICAFYW